MNPPKQQLKPELIEDQEIGSEANPEANAEIQFGLDTFADELEELIRDVPTRTNIAVFAPWGSGKSSLANLLKARLGKRRPDDSRKYRFGRFDAFKFAEESLSRHFISSMAEELLVGSKDVRKQFRQQLYKDEQTKDFKAEAGTRRRLIITAIVIGAIILGVGILIALVASALSKDSFGDMLGKVGTALLIGWAPSVAALTLLVNVLLFKYGVTTDVTRPSGKEEFADKFDELLAKIPDAETIVVFIDELDRCSAEEVVSTLETLKTFLDSERCIFIVAADRKVIERAIEDQARQRTPANEVDPYFSAASSYLDKIFQYQLPLPPIKPHALTIFASDLVSRRGGVWNQLDDDTRDDVVSTVIPTHVINPRRAKVLLNNFALNYRLAERSWKPKMSGTAQLRAVEIAKLSTLKTEFPTFFDDMVRFDDLIDTVLKFEADEAADVRNEELAKVAKTYAQTNSSVSRIIAKAETTEDNTLKLLQTEHGIQLLRYLHKTARVPNPGSDLIYLEPLSTGFDIADEIARELESGARDNAQIEMGIGYSLDAEAQEEAMRFLATLVSRSRRMVGIELRNAMLFTLAFAARMLELSAETANFVAVRFSENEAVFNDLIDKSKDEDGASFSANAAAGAFRIAKAANRSERRLFLRVQKTDVAYEVPALQRALAIWHDLNHAGQINCAQAVARTGAAAVEDGIADPFGDLRDQIAALESNERERFFEYLNEFIEEVEPAQESEDSVTDESDAPNSAAQIRKRVISNGISAVATTKHKDQAILLATMALKRHQPYGIEAVRECLEVLSPIGDNLLVEKVLKVLPSEDPTNWVKWLDAIEPRVFDDADSTGNLDSAVQQLYERALKHPDVVDESILGNVFPAIDRLASTAQRLPDDGLRAVASSELAERPSDDAKAEASKAALALTQAFENAGLLRSDWLPKAAYEAASAWLESEGIPEEAHSTIDAANHVISTFGRHVDPASAQRLATAFESCAWIGTDEARVGALRCSLEQIRSGGKRVDRTDFEAASEVVSARVGRWPEVAALWIEVSLPGPEAIWQLLEVVADTPLDGTIATSLAKAADNFTASEKFALVKDAIARLRTSPIDDSYFKASRIEEADDGRIVRAISQLVSSANDAEEYRIALRLWHLSKPHTTTGSEKLVKEVLHPLLEHGEAGVNLALQEFVVLSDLPEGLHPMVGAAILDKAQPHQVEAVKSEIRNAGWNEDKPWWKKLPN